jgi:ribonuclease-3
MSFVKKKQNFTKEDFRVSDSAGDKQHKVLAALEETIGYSFQDKELLLRALTHRSAFSNDSKQNYERLEFLGDAVLDLAVADQLIEAHPDAREGELSKMRAALVNTEALAELARELSLDKYVILSSTERTQGGATRPSILEDVFEAVLGALYRDGGLEAASMLTQKLYKKRVQTVTPRDPKTELQELLHARAMPAPQYFLEFREGPEHDPIFVSIVKIGDEIKGRGKGRTKKASHQEAAAEALLQLSEDSEKKGKDHVE